MKLTELEPQFVRIDDRGAFTHVATVSEAHGLRFRCPCGCGISVFVRFESRDIPAAYDGLRWAASGSDYSDVTLQPSIHLIRPCGWHGFVTNGEVTTC